MCIIYRQPPLKSNYFKTKSLKYFILLSIMEGYSSFLVMNLCLKHIWQSLHNHVTICHRLHLQESPHDV